MAEARQFKRLEWKAVCEECGWTSAANPEVEFVPDPAPNIEGGWLICPSCRSADSFRMACDEPNCWEFITCGTNTPNGYRSTCGKHYPG